MTTSVALEERFEQLLKLSARKDAQLEYLKKQLVQAMRNNRREIQSFHSVKEFEPSEEEVESHPLDSSDEEEEQRPKRSRRTTHHAMDFKVDISEFEGKQNPDDFLDWLNMVERVFEYKDVPNDKKVKLVALKLRKYTSIWWSSVLSKRVRKRKGKIKS